MGVTVSNTIALRDRMSGVMRGIANTMRTATSSSARFAAQQEKQSRASYAVARATLTVQRAQEAANAAVKAGNYQGYANAQKQIAAANREINKLTGGTKQAGNAAKTAAATGFSKIQAAIVTANQALQLLKAGFAAIGKGAGIADEYALTGARLGLIADETNNVVQLQEKVFQAAQRSRGAYNDTAAAVAKMGLLAKDAFGNTDEIIKFSEILNKSFIVGGAGAQEMAAGTYQLTQAMAAGKLQGDEFRSIMENAPMVGQAIAKYTGKTIGQLKDMSSEGLITADIVKNAMFQSAADIETKFKEMPVTFGQSMTMIKNQAQLAAAPIMAHFSKWLQSDQFTQFANAAVRAFYWIVAGVQTLVGWISQISSYVTANWATIQPILQAAAITVGIILVGSFLSAAAAAIAAAWPLYLIAAIIGIVIWAAMKMGATFEDVCGFIGGLIAGVGAEIWNTLAGLWNPIASLAEFFANVWNHPIYSVKKLFASFATTTLNIIKKIAEAIDWVFGSNLAGSVQSVTDRLNDWVGEMPEGYKVVAKMQEMDIGNSMAAGFESGKKFAGSVADLSKGIDNKLAKIGDFNSPGANATGLNFDIGATANNPVHTKESGDITIADEDLKYMRDVAKAEFVNKFTTLRPNLYAKFGDVRETADVKQIMGAIEDMVENALATSLV